MANINKKYKDRLFCMLFGDAAYKENALALYNALCDTNYTDVAELEIYTIEDVIYIQMKNDVSVLLDSYLYLWEQQSSVNPNMPLRGMMYFGKMYSRYIEENERSVYGHSLIKIPTPRYTVLYNGVESCPTRMKLRLSDAFIHQDKSGDFEWTADVININEGKCHELLDRCEPLKEYMMLVNRIRDNEKAMEIEGAVDEAVAYCIDHGILKEFLVKHRAEVKDVCITEFNEKSFVKTIREEGREEGRAEGRISAIQDMIEFGLSRDQILKRYTESEYEQAKQGLLT